MFGVIFANYFSLIAILVIIAVAIICTILLRLYILDAIKEISTPKRDIELIDRLIHDKKPSVIKRKKIIGIIKNIAFYVFISFLIPILCYAVITKIKGTSPQIGNTTVMVVGSGSMSFKNQTNDYLFNKDEQIFNFQFKRGDIILLKKVTSDNDLHLYDVICYYDSKQGKNIIHRIREINEENGIIKYTTRGDANPGDDEFQPTINDVLGLYGGKKIVLIGNLILFLQDMVGIATFISLIYLLIMVDFYLKKLSTAEKQKMVYFAELIGYQESEIKVISSGLEMAFESISIKYLGVIYQFNHAGLINKQTTDNKLTKEDLLMIKTIKTSDDEEVITIKFDEKGK